VAHKIFFAFFCVNLGFLKLTKNIFLRYIIVGGLSAVAEISLLVTLVEYFFLNPLIANIVSFCVISSLNYLLSRLWVFERTGSKKRIEFPIFLFFLTCGLLINQAVFWLLTDKFFVDYRISKAVSISSIVVWNFLTRKYIVFKSTDKAFFSKYLPNRQKLKSS